MRQDTENPIKRAARLAALGLCAVVALATIALGRGGMITQEGGYDYDAPAGCPLGALCVYDGNQFTGRRYQFFGTNREWDRWDIDNNDQSAFNNGRSGMTVTVYDEAWHGPSYCMRKGHGYMWLPNDYGSANEWQWEC